MSKPDKNNCESPSYNYSKKTHFLAWDREYSHLKWGGPAIVRNLEAYLLPNSRVLDAGSGNGRYLGELSRYYNAIGIDISLKALYDSRAQFAKNGRFAEHLGASIHQLPFKAEIFDGILCYGVLQHLFEAERKSTVQEFLRILKKGGFLFFEAFGTEDMRFGGENPFLFEENTFLRQNGIIYHYFTKEEVNSLFKEFKVLELKDIIKEKNFRGQKYKRHLIKGIFQKL
jgi:SAM-dependent methyltransferase